jgi:hypothetical protein
MPTEPRRQSSTTRWHHGQTSRAHDSYDYPLVRSMLHVAKEHVNAARASYQGIVRRRSPLTVTAAWWRLRNYDEQLHRRSDVNGAIRGDRSIYGSRCSDGVNHDSPSARGSGVRRRRRISLRAVRGGVWWWREIGDKEGRWKGARA